MNEDDKPKDDKTAAANEARAEEGKTEQEYIEELWNFPCEFPFKVMARNIDGVASDIATAINRFAPDDYAPTKKLSRDGNYVSYTFIIQAQSKQQLDAIYLAVNAIDAVRMTL